MMPNYELRNFYGAIRSKINLGVLWGSLALFGIGGTAYSIITFPKQKNSDLISKVESLDLDIEYYNNVDLSSYMYEDLNLVYDKVESNLWELEGLWTEREKITSTQDYKDAVNNRKDAKNKVYLGLASLLSLGFSFFPFVFLAEEAGRIKE